MSGGGVGRFWARMKAANDASYQGARDFATVVVTGVEKDSAGAVLAATGVIDGTGAFTVPLRGTSASAGDHLLVSYPKGDPTGELKFERFVFSEDVSAGLLAVNPDLPAPDFIPPISTTDLDATTTAIDAYIVVYFRAVEAKYNPSNYLISYRAVGGQWVDQIVPHLGGAQQARLSANFPPGTFVDVKLRALYNWNGDSSLPTAPITVRAAVDDISPGSATGLAIDLTVAGGVTLRAAGTQDAAHFGGWIYLVASGTGGPIVAQSGAMPADWFTSLVAGTYYAAVFPISRANPPVVGGRYPGTGFAGPFVVAASTAAPDTTPPANWTSAPTLTPGALQERALITVTLPGGYAYAADYDFTRAYYSVNGGAPGHIDIVYPATTHPPLEVAFGTTIAWLVGYDRAGNFSVTPGPTASITIGNPGAPGAAPVLAAAKFALAVKLTWSAVTAAVWYEVERAPDVSGSPGTYANIARVDSLAYLDTLTGQTIVLPTYWYRVSAINTLGNGPYSTAVTKSVDPVDGRNIRLDSITAGQLAADAAIFQKIQVNESILAYSLMTGSDGVTRPPLPPPGAAESRIEIRGNLPTNRNQIRMIERVSSVDRLRGIISGDAISMFADGASTPGIQLKRDPLTGGVAFYAFGLNVFDQAIQLSIRNSEILTWLYHGPSNRSFVARTLNGRFAWVDADLLGMFWGNVSQQKWVGLNGNGQITWGAGTTPGVSEDVVLYRAAADLLKTDDTFHAATGLIVRNEVAVHTNFGHRHRTTATLGNAAGNQTAVARWESGTASGNHLGLELLGQRGPAGGTSWDEARFRLKTDIDGDAPAAPGGYFELGYRGFSPFWGLGDPTNGTTLFWDQANGRVSVPGALAKGSGTFDIPSPVPGREGTHRLRHGFFESADRGGTLLRLAVKVRDEGDEAVVTDSNGDAHEATVAPVPGPGRGYRVRIALPDWWAHLNESGQVMANPVDQFAGCFGGVIDGGAAVALTVERPGRYTVWVAATRRDAIARAGWDAIGDGAIEYATPEGVRR